MSTRKWGGVTRPLCSEMCLRKRIPQKSDIFYMYCDVKNYMSYMYAETVSAEGASSEFINQRSWNDLVPGIYQLADSKE
ncbi:hypothetical protein QQG55_40915 [Brugia pahangi]